MNVNVLCRTGVRYASASSLDGAWRGARVANRPTPARKKCDAVGIYKSDLLVPSPKFQNQRIMPDDRLLWREVRSGDQGKRVAVMVAEMTGHDEKIVSRMISHKEVLLTTKFGHTFNPPAGYNVHEGDSLAVPKMISHVLWKASEKKEVPKRKLSLAEVKLVRSWVIFKNDACIVINKPPAVPCTPQGGGLSVHDLLEGLKYSYEQSPRIVMRMESEISGCLVIARSPEAYRFLKQNLVQPRVPSFCYWATITRKPQSPQGRVKMNTELHKSPAGDRVVVRMTPSPKTQKVTLEYSSVSTSGSGPCWISLYPISTIRHQLRIATSVALKAPVLGDVAYGGDAALPYTQLGRLMGNMKTRLPLMLHCSQVSLPFPSADGLMIARSSLLNRRSR
eukprot:TRINITY_DN19715_c0_g1_i4.p1 TRINITY_DN19715_c0_g1~~TRINITY_DN19715_c0_g1_i4.p1  ORF type:complete len:392 (+),score=24.72 TRINITY_DN19715_c0_g1_i4:2-1177(+)